MSRATLRRNGPRSGLSSEASERRVLLLVGVSGVFFLEREDGEGEGGFLGSGDGEGGVLAESDLWGGVSGTVIRGGGPPGETRPGMVSFGLGWMRSGKRLGLKESKCEMRCLLYYGVRRWKL